MSENKKYFYLKLKDSFFSSEEMLVLESLPDGLIYQNIYLRMCLLSLKNDGALTFKNMLPYDLKMLATVLRIDIAKMKLALEMFEQLGLVTKTDNEVLFMSDIQTLIGKSSTEAERIQRYRKRIAGCTESVQMLQSCTPEIELKKEIETEQEQEEEACVPSYVPQPLKTNKESFQNFLNDCFLMITEHNKTAKHKIPISKAIMYFTQKEGRDFLQLIKQGYSQEEIKSALENYLKVANSETWKSGFSFNAFCNKISEYTADYFDISKYINAPKNEEDIKAITESFAEKNMRAKWFDYAVFHHHREDWIKAGKPEGDDFIKWADKVYNQDLENGIKY